MTTQETKRKIVIGALQNSVSYLNYRKVVSKLLLENRSTAIEDSQDLVDYSILNDKRMKRWDKTFKPHKDTINFLRSIDSKQTWLVISEGWCGDAAHIVPILDALAKSTDSIELRVVLRDQNPLLMDLYLTHGARSIPKVIILDDNNEEIATWGPRPKVAAKMVVDYKEKWGGVDADFKKDLQLWYNKDKGRSIEKELLKMLTKKC